MFRDFISYVASKLPPKHVSERFTVWATLILAISGSAWALFTYSNDLAVKRVNTTLGFYNEYLDKFSPLNREISDQFKVINRETLENVALERCKFIFEKITVGEISNPNDVFLDCDKTDNEIIISKLREFVLEEDHRKELRVRITNITHALGLKHEILSVLLNFYGAVVVCAEQSNCDESTAIKLFHSPMTKIINLTCLPAGQTLMEGSKRFQIVEFLVSNEAERLMFSENTDPGRASLFLCQEARELEQKLST